MRTIHERLKTWDKFSAVTDEEQQRLAILRQPPAKNPEHLTRLVKIRCIGPRGFIGLNGQPVQPGQSVKVSYACARELVHIGKAIFVDPPEATS
jgi:hypothetical protein